MIAAFKKLLDSYADMQGMEDYRSHVCIGNEFNLGQRVVPVLHWSLL